MQINSLIFLLFFAIVLAVYYGILNGKKKAQNLWLLLVSYFFYGYANWRMIPLLIVATGAFYVLGLLIAKNNGKDERKASLYATIGVCAGVSILLYFKYFNFFIESFSELFNFFGLQTNISTFNIIMPLGVSFFTFKLVSYVIEVHREKMPVTKDLVSFANYVAFFPAIMSGPIDRPNVFIPQLKIKRNFNPDDFVEGSKRVLWGLFEKMCIADRLSEYTDAVFNNYTHHNGTTLIVAAVFYAFQLYTDFAGYSDMAIGVARILGIRCQENFRRPFFSVNIAEYWRKWHMTLTNWLVDYIYTPLSLSFRNMKGKWGPNLAVIINLLAIGMWHGADWRFAFFGLYHGVLLVIVNLTNKRRKKFEKKYKIKNNSIYRASRMIITFILVDISFIVFRSDSMSNSIGYFAQMSEGFGPLFTKSSLNVFSLGILSLLILFFKEYKDEKGYNIHFLHSSSTTINILSFAGLMAYVIFLGELSSSQFIYFQF